MLAFRGGVRGSGCNPMHPGGMAGRVGRVEKSFGSREKFWAWQQRWARKSFDGCGVNQANRFTATSHPYPPPAWTSTKKSYNQRWQWKSLPGSMLNNRTGPQVKLQEQDILSQFVSSYVAGLQSCGPKRHMRWNKHHSAKKWIELDCICISGCWLV